MSNCVKGLYDYDSVKKCRKCGIISLKSDSFKKSRSVDGLNSICKGCMRDCYLKKKDKIILKTKHWNKNNPEKVKQNQKKYKEQNKEKRNIYLKNKRETDDNFRLISNTKNRIYKSLKGMTKYLSTKKVLGIDIETYKKWIKWQMTPDMTWDNIEIDHVRPISLFDISDDEQLKEAFNWRNTQTLIKEIHQKRVLSIIFWIIDYSSSSLISF